jgi:crotonobetainyl-CoA:carnitine CoA-transferase CaiB-like acyl-CoA transferase
MAGIAPRAPSRSRCGTGAGPAWASASARSAREPHRGNRRIRRRLRHERSRAGTAREQPPIDGAARLLPCAGDDHWLTIACEDDAQFAALCAVIGSPELTADERFADVIRRYRNQDAMDGIVSEWTRTQDKHAAADALQAAGVPASPVLTVQDVFADQHLRARGFFEPVSHAVAGAWEMEGTPWRMSETPGHMRVPPPAFAEHNHYVFRELLGLSTEEVAALYEEGVTGDTPNWAVHE